MFLGVVELTGVVVAIILYFSYEMDADNFIEVYIDQGTDAGINLLQVNPIHIEPWNMRMLTYFTEVSENI